jgi:hypothetical protein
MSLVMPSLLLCRRAQHTTVPSLHGLCCIAGGPQVNRRCELRADERSPGMYHRIPALPPSTGPGSVVPNAMALCANKRHWGRRRVGVIASNAREVLMRATREEALKNQLDFLLELDRLKSVVRQSSLEMRPSIRAAFLSRNSKPLSTRRLSAYLGCSQLSKPGDFGTCGLSSRRANLPKRGSPRHWTDFSRSCSTLRWEVGHGRKMAS